MAKEQKDLETRQAEEEKELQLLEKSLDKEYGAGALKSGNTVVDVDTFPTDIVPFDISIGCGGMPVNRIMELYGIESAGKTTLALHIMAKCQQYFFEKKQRKGRVAFIDAEHALDPDWAEHIGLDMDSMRVNQPNSGEEALEIATTLAQSKLFDMIVVDSVAALLPKKMLEGEIGDANIGAQAQLMSRFMSRIKKPCYSNDVALIMLNQVREKIGVMFGNPETTPGGRALKFYSSIRVELRKAATVKDGKDGPGVGITTRFKFVKNKVGPAFTSGTFNIMNGKGKDGYKGIDTAEALLDAALERKIVTRSGSHYRLGDEILGNGRNNVAVFLRECPETFMDIKDKIYKEAFKHLETVPDDIQAELSEGFDEQE